MGWSDTLLDYCERGANPSLWAEPLNLLSNSAFIIAGLACVHLIRQKPVHKRLLDDYILAWLLIVIGIGSSIFHSFATRWAELADLIPLALFMLVYFTIALNRLLEVPPGLTLLLAVLFATLSYYAGQFKCPSFWQEGRCLNGSLGYLTSLLCLAIVGYLLKRQKHVASNLVIAGAGLFAVSLLLRTIDMPLCATLHYEKLVIGSHFLWHILNAIVLYLILRAAILHGREELVAEIIPPKVENKSSSENS